MSKDKLITDFSNYAESVRAKGGIRVPEVTEVVFAHLVNKKKKILTFFVNKICKELNICDPTFKACLTIMENGGFIKKSSTPRAGTTITIKNFE